MNIFIIFPLCAYILLVLLLSAFFTNRALASYSEYSYCGRSLTIAFIFFTYLGTWIGGGTIVGLAGNSYSNGAGQYWLFAISCLFGFLFTLIFNRRIRALQVTSVTDMLALRFPEYKGFIRLPATLGIIIRNVTIVGMNFVAMSHLFNYFAGIDHNLATLLTLFIVLFYTVSSGLWGVVVTDVLQGLLQTVGLMILIVNVIRFCGGLDEILLHFESAANTEFLTLFPNSISVSRLVLYTLTLGTFFLMGDSSDWERIYSCKTDKTAFWGYLIPLSVTLLLLLIPTYVGAFLKTTSISVRPDYIIYYFISDCMPRWQTALLILCILSSTLSTADSFIMSSGVTLSSDIIKAFLAPDSSDKELIFWTRIGVVITGTVGFAFALNMVDIVTLWIVGIGASSVIILPEYFASWFSKRVTTSGALAGMFTGLAYCFYMLLFNDLSNTNAILCGILMNLFIMITVSLLTKPPENAAVNATYFHSARFKKTASREHASSSGAPDIT